MKTILQLLVITLLIVIIISVEQNHHSNNYMSTYNILLQILNNCKKENDALFISTGSKNVSLAWLKNLHSHFSMIIQYDLITLNEMNHTKKFDDFLIIMQSNTNFDQILQNLCNFPWWNVMIPLFVLNESLNGCGMSKSILQKIWSYEILVSYFICSDKNQEIKIYTYNPYSNRAPSEWTEIIKLKKKNSKNGDWTLYERKYVNNNNKDICKGLDFDRTKFLDGYPMTVTCRPRNAKTSLAGKIYNHDFLTQHPKALFPENRRFMEVFAATINVTFRIFIHPNRWKNKAYIESFDRYKSDIYKNTTADLLFILQDIGSREIIPLKRTYPTYWSELAIVTCYQGFMTPLEKIRNFYGIWILLYTLFIIVITFIVIWLAEKRRIAFAIFDVLRMLINNGLYTRMDTLSLRIFFMTVFIYFLIIQATFNGHLAKFLTYPELRKHVNTFEDLQKLGYTSVYNQSTVNAILAKTSADKATPKALVDTCFKYILNNDTSAACIDDYMKLYKSAYRNKALYISKTTFGSSYKQYSIRPNWPLTNRVNLVLFRIAQSGLLKYWLGKKIDFYAHTNRLAEARLDQKFQNIRFEYLMFIFRFLAVGLMAAFVSFCIEIYMGRRLKKKEQMKAYEFGVGESGTKSSWGKLFRLK